MANIQISDKLFFDLVEFFHDESILSRLNGSAEYMQFIEIQGGLDMKLDSMLARLYFSRYKCAPDPDQREEFRRRYLDQVGMGRGFRTESEVRTDF